MKAADIKSAFVKGEFFEESRELFMENIRNPEEPQLPFPDLVRIRKMVFGLSDAPRMWYDGPRMGKKHNGLRRLDAVVR